MTLGLRIKTLRNNKKMTQVQLARLAGVSQATVSDYERDQVPNPRSNELIEDCGNGYQVIPIAEDFFFCCKNIAIPIDINIATPIIHLTQQNVRATNQSKQPAGHERSGEPP